MISGSCAAFAAEPHFATIRSWGTSTSSTPRKEKRSFTGYFGGSRNPWLETDCDRPPTRGFRKNIRVRTVINSSCGQWELSRNPFNILGEQSYGKANRAGRRVAAGDPSRRQPIGGYMAGCRRRCSEPSTNAIARASTNLIVTNSPSPKEYFGALWKEANPASPS